MHMLQRVVFVWRGQAFVTKNLRDSVRVDSAQSAIDESLDNQSAAAAAGFRSSARSLGQGVRIVEEQVRPGERWLISEITPTSVAQMECAGGRLNQNIWHTSED